MTTYRWLSAMTSGMALGYGLGGLYRGLPFVIVLWSLLTISIGLRRRERLEADYRAALDRRGVRTVRAGWDPQDRESWRRRRPGWTLRWEGPTGDVHTERGLTRRACERRRRREIAGWAWLDRATARR